MTNSEMTLESLSVEQLEEVVMCLYNKHKLDITKEIKNKLKELLYERKYKINQTFEWTPENQEKLIRLNQKFIECWEKLDIEAKQMFKTLKNRINNQDIFLHDFEINAEVKPFIYIIDENGDYEEAENCIEEVLIATLEDHVNSHYYGHSDTSEELLSQEIIYLKREQNWSHDRCFDGKFNEHFISQAIHDLYDHTCLSFPDILKINNLCPRLPIEHQHNVEMFNV